MSYPHTIKIQEIPVPAGYIQVKIESDVGQHKSTKEFYGTQEEFLTFWEPLVKYYEGVKHANSVQQRERV